MPKINLLKKYPPSASCGCDICRAFCHRPGWWSVSQAASALHGGLGSRMMLEVAPNRTYAVLSPAFRGCEGKLATQTYAGAGCTFLNASDDCELHASPFLPLECAFCHHERVGLGRQCHADLETDWQTPEGRQLVRRWCRQMGWWEMLGVYGLDSLKR
ncbi:hypothetical protein [Pelolinea submarina]|uniref:Uncharacterized protein n=1 Tax=Pelolinea submarina TaxID=913107 RepID=A0A3E0A336_9CHLR|nr:hypothetical protein [Pelolinea submarina]REG04739.1 hypothetical protein DFR64_3090 [Pelolinea submarina]